MQKKKFFASKEKKVPNTDTFVSVCAGFPLKVQQEALIPFNRCPHIRVVVSCVLRCFADFLVSAVAPARVITAPDVSGNGRSSAAPAAEPQLPPVVLAALTCYCRGTTTTTNTCLYDELNYKLYEWINFAMSLSMPITSKILLTKATAIMIDADVNL